MSGHEIMKAALVSRELMYERERQAQRRQMIQEAKASRSGEIGELSWFGGIKATARFLNDAARAAVAHRRMTEARS